MRISIKLVAEIVGCCIVIGFLVFAIGSTVRAEQHKSHLVSAIHICAKVDLAYKRAKEAGLGMSWDNAREFMQGLNETAKDPKDLVASLPGTRIALPSLATSNTVVILDGEPITAYTPMPSLRSSGLRRDDSDVIMSWWAAMASQ